MENLKLTSESIFKKSDDIKMDMTLFGSIGETIFIIKITKQNRKEKQNDLWYMQLK